MYDPVRGGIYSHYYGVPMNLSHHVLERMAQVSAMLTYVYVTNGGVLPETPEYHQMVAYLEIIERGKQTGTLDEEIVSIYVGKVQEYVDSL